MKPYFLRNVLCVSIALSLLITSVQLPLRQAEAFVPVAIPAAGAAATANTATLAQAINTLVIIGILSHSKEDQKKCAQTFPNNSKTQFCIPPKNGTLDAFIVPAVAYARVVCPTLAQNCLQELQKKANPFLKNLEKKLTKNPVAFKSLCPVFLTLFGMSIAEYCKANGYDVPNTPSGIGAVPPKKGGGGGKISSMGQLPPFLQQIASWVSVAVKRLLDNCPAWLKKLMPFCKEKEVLKTTPTTIPTTIPTTTPPKKNPEKEKHDALQARIIKTLETSAEKRQGKKLDFDNSNPDIQALLYEILLTLHKVVTAQLSKPKNSRDSNVYNILAFLFATYSQQMAYNLTKERKLFTEHLNTFTAPQKFPDYRYTEETSRKFLLQVLGIPEENVNLELSKAIATFEKITKLLPKEDLLLPTVFWIFEYDLNDVKNTGVQRPPHSKK
jgi:hypothetical protein